MERIINKKRYNTETANKIAEYCTGIGWNYFNYLEEELYISPKGKFFIYFNGGAASKYSGSKGIKLISNQEAYDWLELYDFTDEIEEYFTDKIEEG